MPGVPKFYNIAYFCFLNFEFEDEENFCSGKRSTRNAKKRAERKEALKAKRSARKARRSAQSAKKRAKRKEARRAQRSAQRAKKRAKAAENSRSADPRRRQITLLITAGARSLC